MARGSAKIAESVPPASETRINPLSCKPSTITPAGLHEARRVAQGRSHRICGDPPEASTFLSSPSAANPNIKITGTGAVKVLDFGLAKIADMPAADPQDSPTLTMTETQAGVILGTAAYMAPEQARGKNVDRRADIWAFGTVLYEMLTGERAFPGDSAAELLGAVIHKEPDLDRVPKQVRRLLRWCLEKDPKMRPQWIADWHLIVDDGTPEAQPKPAEPKPAPFRTSAGWLAAGAMTLALAALSFIHFREKPPSNDLVTFEVSAPEKSRFIKPGCISPDGRQIAFATREPDGRIALWVHALDSNSARRLAGTEGVTAIFWSPDSRFIMLFAGVAIVVATAVGSRQNRATLERRGWDAATEGTAVPPTGHHLYLPAAASSDPPRRLCASNDERSLDRGNNCGRSGFVAAPDRIRRRRICFSFRMDTRS
ncbi:MAG TPA: protein kinase [Bryobacteraceae bacterium]|nr:protein kinase [Bryobacteraceae bacterium]